MQRQGGEQVQRRVVCVCHSAPVVPLGSACCAARELGSLVPGLRRACAAPPPPPQGFYSENLQQERAVGLPVSMHLFEYTAR